MALRAHHYGVTFMIAAIILGSLAFLTTNSRIAQAACASGSSVYVTYPTTTASTTLSGIVTLKAQSNPAGATGLSYMLMPTNAALGQATQSGADWILSWDTRNQPNGSYQIMAMAHFGTDTTKDCASAAVPANIANTATQTPKLAAALTPPSAQIPAGGSATFAVDTMYVDQYGRTSHVTPASINWQPNTGTVAPSGTSVVLHAGTVLGTGSLGVTVAYSGLTAHADAPLKIVAPTTSTASPTPLPGTSPTPNPSASPAAPGATPGPLSAADATRLAAMTTIFRPANPTNSEPDVSLPTLGCVEKNLGTQRFADISSGKSQPTAAERKDASSCFSGIEPLPAILAPVAPAHIADLTATTDFVTVAEVKKQSITAKDGQKIDGLLLSGKGAPSSSIYIYIFSDPLVLRAETDKTGTWKYVLETPLPSGNHEIYAVAETDSNNFVRTSAVPIAIAAAAPGAKNGALIIDGKLSSTQLAFAAAAAVMVVLAIIAFFLVLRSRRRARASSPLAGSTVMPAGPDESSEPSQPSQPSESNEPMTSLPVSNTPVPKSLAPDPSESDASHSDSPEASESHASKPMEHEPLADEAPAEEAPAEPAPAEEEPAEPAADASPADPFAEESAAPSESATEASDVEAPAVETPAAEAEPPASNPSAHEPIIHDPLQHDPLPSERLASETSPDEPAPESSQSDEPAEVVPQSHGDGSHPHDPQA